MEKAAGIHGEAKATVEQATSQQPCPPDTLPDQRLLVINEESPVSGRTSLFIIEMTMAGRKVKAMIDSGATGR